MGFSAQDFPKILEYGGKEFLDMEYKDYECIPDLEINKTKFNLGIKISLAKYKKAFEKKDSKPQEKKNAGPALKPPAGGDKKKTFGNLFG